MSNKSIITFQASPVVTNSTRALRKAAVNFARTLAFFPDERICEYASPAGCSTHDILRAAAAIANGAVIPTITHVEEQ